MAAAPAIEMGDTPPKAPKRQNGGTFTSGGDDTPIFTPGGEPPPPRILGGWDETGPQGTVTVTARDAIIAAFGGPAPLGPTSASGATAAAKTATDTATTDAATPQLYK